MFTFLSNHIITQWPPLFLNRMWDRSSMRDKIRWKSNRGNVCGAVTVNTCQDERSVLNNGSLGSMTHVSRWWFLIDPAMVKHTGGLDEMDVLEESHAVTGDDEQ